MRDFSFVCCNPRAGSKDGGNAILCTTPPSPLSSVSSFEPLLDGDDDDDERGESCLRFSVGSSFALPLVFFLPLCCL